MPKKSKATAKTPPFATEAAVAAPNGNLSQPAVTEKSPVETASIPKAATTSVRPPPPSTSPVPLSSAKSKLVAGRVMAATVMLLVGFALSTGLSYQVGKIAIRTRPDLFKSVARMLEATTTSKLVPPPLDLGINNGPDIEMDDDEEEEEEEDEDNDEYGDDEEEEKDEDEDEEVVEDELHDDGTCKDRHRDCAMWAGRKECKKNPNYMRKYCRVSCGVCVSETGEEDVDYMPGDEEDEEENEIVGCTNMDDECDFWAEQGECELNPSYMETHCALACGTCSQNGDEPMDEDDGQVKVCLILQRNQI